MKNILIIAIFFISINIVAQNSNISKTEAKEIKAKLKNFKKKPATYKSMVTNYENSIKDRDIKMEEMELELARLKAKSKMDLDECNDSINAIRNRLNDAIKNANSGTNSATLPAGTVYGVQIGNYAFFDITQYFGKDKYIMAFNDNDANQYVITYFNDSKSADACRQDFKKLGIKDAFVTKYVDGKRVPFDINSDK